MREIVHMVRNVTLFLVMGNILTNLFNGTKYRKYFTFVTGIIVVAMVVTPVFSLLNDESILENYLDKSVLSIKHNDIKTEIEMSGQRMEERILKEYEKQVAEIVMRECNLTEDTCRVKINMYKGGEKKNSIKSIVIYVGRTPDGVSDILKNLSVKLGVPEDRIEIRMS